jgi:hypothetical protein
MRRSLPVSLALAACLLAAAAPVASARKSKPPAGDIALDVEFTGTGTFTSNETDAVEAASDGCQNATDNIVENTTVYWDTKYVVDVPRTGELLGHEVDGTDFQPKTKPTWSQTSTVTPAGCLGPNENCTGTLNPSASGKRPAAVISLTKKDDEVSEIQSVVDWTVEDATGSSTCSIYDNNHTALEPFSLAAHLSPNNSSYLVKNAMAAFLVLPHKPLQAGRKYTTNVKQPPGNTPPANCVSLTIDAISCSEQLSWHGKLEISRGG